jgi:hypothetical protein
LPDRYWPIGVDRYGFDVTVFKRADAIRNGGYPFDVRGTAIDIVERMGELSQLRAAHIDTPKLRFVEADGKAIATIVPEYLDGGATARHIEVATGRADFVVVPAQARPAGPLAIH